MGLMGLGGERERQGVNGRRLTTSTTRGKTIVPGTDTPLANQEDTEEDKREETEEGRS